MAVDDQAGEDARRPRAVPRSHSGCRGSICAHPLPRCVASVAPAAIASAICRGVAAVWPIATRTPDATRCSMSGSAPGTSGASVTSTIRPPAASCRRLKSSTLGGDDVLARMRAARRRPPATGTDPPCGCRRSPHRHPRQHARARGELLEGRGDQRRQAARDAGRAHALERFGRAIGGQIGPVEIDAAEAVHLQIEEPRQLDRPHRRM